jgi:hypothetical protein
MKTALAICVISYLLVVGYAFDLGNIASCAARVSSCTARLLSASTDNSFCTDCAISLVGDCAGSDAIVDALMECKSH